MLHEWAKDPNIHVRRLVSEGTRPKLPWAPQLPEFRKDPGPVLELLEKLKQDPQLYVRRSVANNLNDIAKDHPDVVVKVLNEWKDIGDEGVQWILGHASRTLVKAGNLEALALLGYPPNPEVEVRGLVLRPDTIQIGEELAFDFEVLSMGDQAQRLMIDYTVHFMKANGKQAPKVFKLSKKEIRPGEVLTFSKVHSFKKISTRKYYAGDHRLELKINGKAYGECSFRLKAE